MNTPKFRSLNFTYLTVIYPLTALVVINHCALIQLEDFYSQSFIPKALQISYRIDNNISINYNVTMLMPFPGKILFNVFVRKLVGGNRRSQDMLKYKNMDFCKTLEVMKNFTMSMDNFHSDPTIQSTFIRSCPLTSGFFYITNGTLDDEIVPVYFTSGQYWLQFELVQVFDEVTKIANLKVKAAYRSRW